MRQKKQPPQMYEPQAKSASYGSFARTPRPKGFVPTSPVVNTTFVRETPEYNSVNTQGGSTGNPVTQKPLLYTGDRVKGISLMHKSCFQPVFSDTEAKEHAQMRR